MLDIPLPETTLRKLELQRHELLDAYRFTGDKHLTLHQRERERNLRIAAQAPEGTGGRQSVIADAYVQAGVPQTVGFARARFDQIAGECLKKWQASDDIRHELFAALLERIKAQVLADVTNLWRKTPWHKNWFKRTCRTRIESELSNAVKEWVAHSRTIELKRIVENDARSPAATNVEQNQDVAPVSPLPTGAFIETALRQSQENVSVKETRRRALNEHNRAWRAVGIRRFQPEIAKAAKSSWNTRTPVSKWLADKCSPAHARLIDKAVSQRPAPQTKNSDYKNHKNRKYLA